jgi:hypothetical protein
MAAQHVGHPINEGRAGPGRAGPYGTGCSGHETLEELEGGEDNGAARPHLDQPRALRSAVRTQSYAQAQAASTRTRVRQRSLVTLAQRRGGRCAGPPCGDPAGGNGSTFSSPRGSRPVHAGAGRTKPLHMAHGPSAATMSRRAPYVLAGRAGAEPSWAAMTRVLMRSKGCVTTDATLPAAMPLHRLTSIDTPSPECRFVSPPSGHAHASSPPRGACSVRACTSNSIQTRTEYKRYVRAKPGL